ncbi:MAG: hypothetical protein NTV43_15030 [Methylococcales bacterium]|nr:hypothetical protein [Methylococcales bacterium]
MKHTANISYRDAILCLWLAATFLSSLRYLYLGVILFISFYPLLPSISADPLIGLPAGAISAGIMLIAFLLLTFVFTLIQCTTLKLRNGVIGEHDFEVTDKAFTEATAHNKSVNSWESISQVRHVFGLLLIQRSGGDWYVIPDRSFSSMDAARAFSAYVRDRVRA